MVMEVMEYALIPVFTDSFYHTLIEAWFSSLPIYEEVEKWEDIGMRNKENI